MKTLEMPPNPLLLLAWFTRLASATLSTLLLMNVPNEFWAQLIAILEVPDVVKVAVAPFMGSAVTTAVEYLVLPLDPNQKKWHWPLKLFVGWVVGSYGGGAADIVFKGDAQTLAFWGGVTGYGTIALILYNQRKKLNDNDTH